MATANLGLEEINGSDYIDPAVFNRNSEKVDKLGKKYVVGSGKSGEWEWEKWSDGTAVCRIRRKTFPSQAFGGWGELWATSAMRFSAYPFNFAEVPSVKIEFEGCDSSGNWPFVSKTSQSTTSQSPAFCLYSAMQETVTNPKFSIEARGRV